MAAHAIDGHAGHPRIVFGRLLEHGETVTEKRAQRKLAAILAADVAGYSRLVGVDEEGALAALAAMRKDVLDLKIAEYGGRIANTAGDSIFAEFPSIVEALRCAIEVQRSVGNRNAKIVAERQLEFRIGLNVGDVIDQDGDLLGDGLTMTGRIGEWQTSEIGTPSGPIIGERDGGPLVAKGVPKLIGAGGQPLEIKPAMVLCRCGASKNKPFCDGPHNEIGFDSRKRPHPALGCQPPAVVYWQRIEQHNIEQQMQRVA